MPSETTVWNLEDWEAHVEAKDAPLWLIPEVLTYQGINIICGAPKRTRKTLFAMRLALALARGENETHPLFKPTRAFSSLFIEEEGSEKGNLYAWRGVKSGLGFTSEQLSAPIYWVHRSGIKLNEPDWQEWLLRTIATYNPDVVFLDPLALIHSFNENNNTDMNAFVNILRQVLIKTKVTLVILHHAGKSEVEEAKFGITIDPDNLMRGASAIAGSYDSRWFLAKKAGGNDGEILAVTRHKNAEEGRYDFVWTTQGKGAAYRAELHAEAFDLSRISALRDALRTHMKPKQAYSTEELEELFGAGELHDALSWGLLTKKGKVLRLKAG